MRLFRTALLAVALVLPPFAGAQQLDGLEGFDPAALVSGVQDLLERAPDREIDGLFQALHGSMRAPEEAEAICGLFEPGADRSLDGLGSTAMRLPEASRQRFADAIANLVVFGLQGSPRPLDRAAASQALKSNAARAAILHDGFAAGFAETAPQAARCRSLRQMMDVLAQRPQPERALVTRLLLEQGLRQAMLP